MAASSLSRVSALPGVWRGEAWAQAEQRTVETGHAALDAQLPGGGWPLAAMSEVLLPHHTHQEWNLVAPALAQRLSHGAGRAVLVAPPLEPFVPALQQSGIAAQQLCWVRTPPGGRDAAAAWACEQALRGADVRAVLAWLPQADAGMLRRLQLAAAQQQRLLWVFRPEAARQQASPAPLRLWLQVRGDVLQVHVIKRRGPPLAQPVALPARSARLVATLQAQAWRRSQAQQAAGVVSAQVATGRTLPARSEESHALAGVALATGG